MGGAGGAIDQRRPLHSGAVLRIFRQGFDIGGTHNVMHCEELRQSTISKL
jgi:hypothetical protein